MDTNGILWDNMDTLPDVSDSELDELEYRVSPSGSEATTSKKKLNPVPTNVVNNDSKITQPRSSKNRTPKPKHDSAKSQKLDISDENEENIVAKEFKRQGSEAKLSRAEKSISTHSYIKRNSVSSSDLIKSETELFKRSNIHENKNADLKKTDTDILDITQTESTENKGRIELSRSSIDSNKQFKPIPRISSGRSSPSEKDMTSGGKEIHKYMSNDVQCLPESVNDNIDGNTSVAFVTKYNSTSNDLTLTDAKSKISSLFEDKMHGISDKYNWKRTHSERKQESDKSLKEISEKYRQRRKALLDGIIVSSDTDNMRAKSADHVKVTNDNHSPMVNPTSPLLTQHPRSEQAFPYFSSVALQKQHQNKKQLNRQENDNCKSPDVCGVEAYFSNQVIPDNEEYVEIIRDIQQETAQSDKINILNLSPSVHGTLASVSDEYVLKHSVSVGSIGNNLPKQVNDSKQNIIESRLNSKTPLSQSQSDTATNRSYDAPQLYKRMETNVRDRIKRYESVTNDTDDTRVTDDTHPLVVLSKNKESIEIDDLYSAAVDMLFGDQIKDDTQTNRVSPRLSNVTSSEVEMGQMTSTQENIVPIDQHPIQNDESVIVSGEVAKEDTDVYQSQIDDPLTESEEVAKKSTDLYPKESKEQVSILVGTDTSTDGFSIFAEPINDASSVEGDSNTQSFIDRNHDYDTDLDVDTDTESQSRGFTTKRSDDSSFHSKGVHSDNADVYRRLTSRNTISSASSQG